jgi:hypothetical protein
MIPDVYLGSRIPGLNFFHPNPGSRNQRSTKYWILDPQLCLRIRVGLNADPDPAFYLYAYPDPGSQITAKPDPDPGQTLPLQKVEFLHEKYTLCQKTNLRT